MHHFDELQGQPKKFWWATTAVGLATALVLFVYDRVVRPTEAKPEANAASSS
jgi:hypothetical protein